jgi:hypothetical protein
MSLKELVQYHPHLKRSFGNVDFGGEQDLGECDTPAKEALVCMLVGYRKFWKLPIAYFFVKGTKGSVVAGITSLSIIIGDEAKVS